jgi:hypothetical protein
VNTWSNGKGRAPVPQHLDTGDELAPGGGVGSGELERLLGTFAPRSTSRGALIGWLGELAMTLRVCFGTNISFLWYAMTGCLI